MVQASEAELREALEQRGAVQLGVGWHRLSQDLQVGEWGCIGHWGG
jgi:hypothetical protein